METHDGKMVKIFCRPEKEMVLFYHAKPYAVRFDENAKKLNALVLLNRRLKV